MEFVYGLIAGMATMFLIMKVYFYYVIAETLFKEIRQFTEKATK